MNRPRRIALPLAACSLLFLTACPVVRIPAHPSQPEPVEADGDYVHPFSGMEFPETVGPFRREAILRYDAFGRNVSATYTLPGRFRQVLATVYVYPPPGADVMLAPKWTLARTGSGPMSPQEEFARTKESILRRYPDAIVQEEGETASERSGRTFPGLKATIEFSYQEAGHPQYVISHLHLYSRVTPDWNIKYRISHARDHDVSREVQDFLGALDWTLKDL